MSTPLLIHEPLDSSDPLAEWRWKLGGEAQALALSRSGDAFVIQPDGKVWWLDTGVGELSEVAPSTAAFNELLTHPEHAARLLLAPVVEEFIRLHGPIPEGRCLSFTQLPVFGGGYGVENRWLAPVIEHFGFTGDLHRQIRDLPNGAKTVIRIQKRGPLRPD